MGFRHVNRRPVLFRTQAFLELTMVISSHTSDTILARMMALHPKIIDLTLDRMWRLLEALGHPQERLPPVVHLAGTNGKGSTQAMIRQA